MNRNGDGWNDVFVGTGYKAHHSFWYWYEKRGSDFVQHFNWPGAGGWKNVLYLNDRKGGFTAVQNALTVSKESTLGVALGDLDAVRIVHAWGSTLQPCL